MRRRVVTGAATARGRRPPISFRTVARLALVAAALLLGESCRPSVPEPTRRPRPLLPVGALESPRDGEEVRGTAVLTGWAVAPGGVEEVAIYVDRRFFTTAQRGEPRPDIGTAFFQFPDAERSGWSAAVSTRRLTSGLHEFTAQARARSGAVRDLGNVRLSVVR